MIPAEMFPGEASGEPTTGVEVLGHSRWTEEPPAPLSRGSTIVLVFTVVFALLLLNFFRVKRKHARELKAREERKARLAKKISESHRRKPAA